MISLTFFDVSQGDSILIEWERDNKCHAGIIDCNVIDGRNPILDYIKSKPELVIDFIFLTHFHSDHFSGFCELFQYFIDKKIKINCFYHTITPFIGQLYDNSFTTDRLQKVTDLFFDKYEQLDNLLGDKVCVNAHTSAIKIVGNIYLKVLSPQGRVFDEIQKQLSRTTNKISTTIADINKLATILFLGNDEKGVLLTSDSVKKSFKKLRDKVKWEITAVQVPHHGSWKNIDEQFWDKLNKENYIPAIFSVGDVPRDKLPNIDTVSFFNIRNFDIHSTNCVYGIEQYFIKSSSTFKSTHSRSSVLNSFSTLRKTKDKTLQDKKLNGNQVFNLVW